MRRFRAVLGALTVALCALLALAVATDAAVAHPGIKATETDLVYAAPVAAAAAGVAAAPGQTPGAFNVEEDRHPDPYDDCRHRRAIRATVGAPTPQPEPCELCCIPEPPAHTALSRRPAVHPACAAVPAPGERPALLQVFRC
jgi:hypothetical protein